jgi:glycosyltransferase involved in cell wall biosynthesis
MCGRWSEGKGYETLLDAWNRTQSTARLIILGGPPPSGRPVDVRALVRGLRHPETVEVVGEVDDIGPSMRRAHCVLVPSLERDSLPTIAVEASAHGRAVIGSNCGGIPEIVVHEGTGILVPSGDSESLATAIDRLTAEDAARMGTAGRRRFEQRFSSDRFADDVRQLLGLGPDGFPER